ncbi:GNAT family N-acetyltransferase [Pedococcus sp.]|uniref:GNAT family N-acetyltransferase n=1 Tax=Pedococcus sp. TaxID=2860345 RepID=UPI002E0EC55A|nr:GNAT family N-acetyltransferase [Pedococcus sp.]
MSDISVTDHPERHRFEATVQGELAGFAVYRLKGDTVAFVHTEVDPAFEGRGVGGALARAALDDVRRRGGRVVAQCPFIARWIQRHPDYQDLLAA